MNDVRTKRSYGNAAGRPHARMNVVIRHTGTTKIFGRGILYIYTHTRRDDPKIIRFFCEKYEIYYFALRFLVTFEMLSVNTNKPCSNIVFPLLETSFMLVRSVHFRAPSSIFVLHLRHVPAKPYSFRVILRPSVQVIRN